MKLIEKMKCFYLKKMENGGFTLVELIVVIAILAILAGVAVPAYSGYVEKANKAADQSLVGEVKQALALSYYSNPDGVQGVVVLSSNVAPDCGGDDVLEEALTKAFGAGWENREDLKLKHDGWNATFRESNYYSDTEGLEKLLGTVDTLTGALGSFLGNANVDLNDSGAFTSYVNAMAGADGSDAAKADAAVFYLAETTGNLNADALSNAAKALQSQEVQQGGSDAALAAMNGELNSSLASMAALYALAEGYATYFETNNYQTIGEADTPREILNQFNTDIQSVASADDVTTAKVFGELFAKFNAMGQSNGEALQAYLNDGVEQDLNAFSEAMKMISASKDTIINSNTEVLGADNYFNNDIISNLFGAYAEGCVFVYVLEDDGGKLNVSSSVDEE